jgi:hypothetical protein
MPQKFTVRECFNLDDGDVVGEVEGKIQKMLKPLENQHGFLQNAEIVGDDGYVGRITFADNNQNEQHANGQLIKIKSVKNDKHGWLGAKMKKGPKGLAIWVTSTAEITYPGMTERSNGKTEQAPPRDEPRTQSATRPPPVLKPARWHIENMADLFAACFALVNEKIMPVALQGGETPDAVLEMAQAMATSLFIQCDRNQIIQAWDKDAKPLPVVPPPERWREAVILSGEYAGKTLRDLPNDKLQLLFDYYDGKKLNTPFAECVYAAVEELRAAERTEHAQKPGYDPALDPDPDGDDIPFLWIIPFYILTGLGASVYLV